MLLEKLCAVAKNNLPG